MTIDYLANHKQHIPVLARWFQAQWGHLKPVNTLEQRIARLHHKATTTSLPLAFIAIEGYQAVGSVSLVNCDMQTRPDYRPWLSSLFVATDYRGQGVGTRLIDRVRSEAAQRGFDRLYLWTPDQEAFYAKRGWRVIEYTPYRGEQAIVMVRRLVS
jgi:GNAT superfamily N-acetyltransferase